MDKNTRDTLYAKITSLRSDFLNKYVSTVFTPCYEAYVVDQTRSAANPLIKPKSQFHVVTSGNDMYINRWHDLSDSALAKLQKIVDDVAGTFEDKMTESLSDADYKNLMIFSQRKNISENEYAAFLKHYRNNYQAVQLIQSVFNELNPGKQLSEEAKNFVNGRGEESAANQYVSVQNVYNKLEKYFCTEPTIDASGNVYDGQFTFVLPMSLQ